jgi:hypothetical protein
VLTVALIRFTAGDNSEADYRVSVLLSEKMEKQESKEKLWRWV